MTRFLHGIALMVYGEGPLRAIRSALSAQAALPHLIMAMKVVIMMTLEAATKMGKEIEQSMKNSMKKIQTKETLIQMTPIKSMC